MWGIRRRHLCSPLALALALALALVEVCRAAGAQSVPLPPPLEEPPGAMAPLPEISAANIAGPRSGTPAPNLSVADPSITMTTPPQGNPIDLPTAMQLAGVRPLDIAAATVQVKVALALLLQAKALWIPNINGGLGYYRHDGSNQDLFTGTLFHRSTNSLQLGGGPTLNVNLADALFAPLAAKRVVGARQADLQAARNDTLNLVARSYFDVQEARGRLVGAEEALVRAGRLVQFAQGQAPALIAPLEINRARTELENLRQTRELAIRDWRQAGARLAEVLLLEPTVLLDPVEPPFLQVTLIPAGICADDLVPVALRNRPEIASRNELLAAADMLLRREKARPFVPNLVATSPATASAGVLSAGQFYTGPSGTLTSQGSRDDFTLSAYWQLSNGGLGNLGLIRQRKAEREQAAIDVTRILFRVRSEVSQSLADLQTARARVTQAEEELRQAIASADKNFTGLRETTRPAGELLNLVVRPQEVVAAIQQLIVAYQDYSGAVNGFNRAQFDLYRALGQPAQWVTSLQATPVSSAPPSPSPAAPAAGAARASGRTAVTPAARDVRAR